MLFLLQKRDDAAKGGRAGRRNEEKRPLLAQRGIVGRAAVTVTVASSATTRRHRGVNAAHSPYGAVVLAVASKEAPAALRRIRRGNEIRLAVLLPRGQRRGGAGAVRRCAIAPIGGDSSSSERCSLRSGVQGGHRVAGDGAAAAAVSDGRSVGGVRGGDPKRCRGVPQQMVKMLLLLLRRGSRSRGNRAAGPKAFDAEARTEAHRR